MPAAARGADQLAARRAPPASAAAMPTTARRGAELGARAQQQQADEMQPPLRSPAPLLRRELKPPTPDARARQPSRARPLLFASDSRHCRTRARAAAHRRSAGSEPQCSDCAASLLPLPAAADVKLQRRAQLPQPASSGSRTDGCRGVRIWAQAPLAPSGAVSRSCTRSSVGFLSALRGCDARAALVPQQSRLSPADADARARSINVPWAICTLDLPVQRGRVRMHTCAYPGRVETVLQWLYSSTALHSKPKFTVTCSIYYPCVCSKYIWQAMRRP